jgi:hypothetical protein
MFNAVLKFLQECNIEDKLFAITLDNASNNNAMMKLLKANLLEKKMLLRKRKVASSTMCSTCAQLDMQSRI